MTVDLSAIPSDKLKEMLKVATDALIAGATVVSFTTLGTSATLSRNWFPSDIVTLVTQELVKRGDIQRYSSKPIKAGRTTHY